jgi:hypothetical protein
MNDFFQRLLTKVSNVACQPNLIMILADKLLNRVIPAADAHACSLTTNCYWQDACQPGAEGACIYYKSELCLNSCGYWQWSGNTCCYTTVPDCTC